MALAYNGFMKCRLITIFFLALAAALPAQEPDGRPILAVLDLMVSGISVGEGALFSDALTSHLVGSGAYRVIERSERDAVLKEIEFSLSDCSDESCQLQAGRLLSASRIVVGSIGALGNLFLVSLRLLEVESGEALAGISEKYPSLDAMASDQPRLAAALSGGKAAGVFRPLTAQSLITSAKAEELKARLARLLRRVRPKDYAEWLRRKGFAGYERDAAVEEKLVFLKEYLDQTNPRGHSLDLAACFLLPHGYSVYTSIGDLGTQRLRGFFGITAGWSYQFNSIFSAGLWVSTNLGPADLSVQASGYHSDYLGFALGAGPMIVVGDKVTGLAVSLGSGYGTVGGPALPLRAGLYFRNFYAGYTGWPTLAEGSFHHQVEAGYSIFFGRRQSWPSRP